MKKFLCIFIALILAVSLCSCGIYSDSNGSDELSERVMEATSYSYLLAKTGRVGIDYTITYYGTDAPLDITGSVRIAEKDGVKEVNMFTDNEDGTFTHNYYSGAGNTIYSETDEGFTSYPGADSSLETLMEESFFGYEFYFCQSEYSADGKSITIKYYDPSDKTLLGTDTLEVSEQDGVLTVLSAECERFEGGETSQKQSVTFDYSDSVVIDTSPENAG